MVSITCITYNHENFIADAIESFLMQKTDFNFEIIIYDDASTDNTSNIIKKYEMKYPNLIKPIYQIENQYSKGNEKVSIISNVSKARGKYLAICEGDDYWTHPYKLQKQIDYMEGNPDCSLCFHNAILVDKNKNYTGRVHVPYTKYNSEYYYGENRKYNAGQLALLDFIPTASLLFPKYLINKLPQFYFHSIYGDMSLRLILAHSGYAFYIDETMSAYRVGINGSATDTLSSSHENIMRHFKSYVEILDNFDEYADYMYHQEIDDAKSVSEFQMYLYNKEIGCLKNASSFRNLLINGKSSYSKALKYNLLLKPFT